MTVYNHLCWQKYCFHLRVYNTGLYMHTSLFFMYLRSMDIMLVLFDTDFYLMLKVDYCTYNRNATLFVLNYQDIVAQDLKDYCREDFSWIIQICKVKREYIFFWEKSWQEGYLWAVRRYCYHFNADKNSRLYYVTKNAYTSRIAEIMKNLNL